MVVGGIGFVDEWGIVGVCEVYKVLGISIDIYVIGLVKICDCFCVFRDMFG